MLKLVVRLNESFDDDKQEFVGTDVVLELEHSLVSLSKWESKFEKPFLGPVKKTTEETLGYIECMISTPDYPPDIVKSMQKEHLAMVQVYIDAKMTATWFNEPKTTAANREQITSELIYFWMFSYQIPIQAENWHLNRLLTLIKVFNAKNDTKRKRRSASEIAAERQMLNEQRRRQLGTTG